MNLCVTFFWCLFSIWFSSALAEDSPLKILKDRSQNFQAKSSGLGYGTTKEEILENRKNRRRQLRNLINDMRKKLANHSAGEITLAPDEKAAIEKRLDIFQRKLNSMEVELDEKDIERIIARETSNAKRRSARDSRTRSGDEL